MGNHSTDTERWTPVSPDRAARGHAIAERRVMLGITSQAEFARRAGMSRNTIAKAEAGTASPNTYLELEAWLNQESASLRPGELGEGESEAVDRIEFDIIGPTTEWRLTVSGPIEEASVVREQATELLKELGFTAGPGNAEEGPRAEQSPPEGLRQH